MSRPETLNKAGDPRFIPGIYNYCDRWCERCAYTARCLNFQMMNEDGEKEEDIDSKAFWKEMETTFQKTKDLLTYVAKEQGIDLDNLEPDPEYERKSEARREEAQNHILVKNSLKYIYDVQNWLKAAEPLLSEKEAALNKNLKMGIAEEQTRESGDRLTNALEVIRWYHFQINVKLMRALSNDDDLLGIDEDDDYQSDADGSAKVALIGMDRSLSAWGVLHDELPELADEILDFLVLLEQLRRKTEQEFPKARDFVRPGFDTDDEPGYEG